MQTEDWRMLFIMLQKNYPDISLSATICVDRAVCIINQEIYNPVMGPWFLIWPVWQ